MQSDRPIASREFENCEGPVVMSIYAPAQRDDGAGFDCRCEVRWSDGTTKGLNASGVDSMQALLMAISCAWVRMVYPKIGQRDKSLTFHGKPELHLDLMPPPDPLAQD